MCPLLDCVRLSHARLPVPQLGSLLDPFQAGAGAGSSDSPPGGHDDDDDMDSDASDTELGGDDKEFLRQLQRARERAKDTRPLVSLTCCAVVLHTAIPLSVHDCRPSLSRHGCDTAAD